MICLDDQHFMMIEPDLRTLAPVEDDLTRAARAVMEKAAPVPGIAYIGFHRCSCGQISDNLEWNMPDGRTTNNLVVHYVACHRADIPRSEIAKLLVYAQDLK